MIAKNIKGKSFGGCVRYVMNDGHELLAADGIFADDTESIIRSFAMQRAGRPEILKPVGHIPLSFSTEDSPLLTNEFIIQLAGEYMKEMGIANTQYVIVRHHNTAHDHIHIIYNRIDNDLKLISVNHDYQRNVKTCKKLKDRHGLTYGEGKEKVNVRKLANPDKVKYEIYDAMQDVLPCCSSYHDLEDLLGDYDITVQYKLHRGTDQIEGVSFRKDDIAFKGSAVDRTFSHANLQKAFEENRKAQAAVVTPADFDLSKHIPDTPKQEPAPITPPPKPAPEHSGTQKQPTTPQSSIRKRQVWGVEITDEQDTKLKNGEYLYLENMRAKDGRIFSAYIFLNDEKTKAITSKINPDEFVKYGQYEMRVRDKRLIETGNITRATVKWYGGGSYAHPYLWKENPDDTEYKESWDDPRKPKQTQVQTEGRKAWSPAPPKKKSGIKM